MGALSQSLLPCTLIPINAHCPPPKTHCSQTLPNLTQPSILGSWKPQEMASMALFLPRPGGLCVCCQPHSYRKACTTKPPSGPQIQLHCHKCRQKKLLLLTHKSWPLCHPLSPLLWTLGKPGNQHPHWPETPKQQGLPRRDSDTWKALFIQGKHQVPGWVFSLTLEPQAWNWLHLLLPPQDPQETNSLTR